MGELLKIFVMGEPRDLQYQNTQDSLFIFGSTGL